MHVSFTVYSVFNDGFLDMLRVARDHASLLTLELALVEYRSKQPGLTVEDHFEVLLALLNVHLLLEASALEIDRSLRLYALLFQAFLPLIGQHDSKLPIVGCLHRLFRCGSFGEVKGRACHFEETRRRLRLRKHL